MERDEATLKNTIKIIRALSGSHRHALLLPAAITLLSATIVLSLVFMLGSGQNITLKYTPLINAAAQIRFHTTNAYLQLEGFLQGRKPEHIETVWLELSKADQYAVLMLNGGQFEDHKYLPLSEPELRNHLTTLRELLTGIIKLGALEYQDYLVERHNHQDHPSLETVYRRILSETFYIEAQLQQRLGNALDTFQQRSNIMIGIILLLAAGLFLLLKNILGNNLSQLQEIQQADDLIRKKNAHLEQLAYFDHLTGLPNRPLFDDRTRQAILHAQRENYAVVILYIDLDHFKSINDTLGHAAGDQLLIELGKRISQAIRKEDTVSRLSGDEFAILLANIPDINTAEETAAAISEKILFNLQKPFELSGRKISVSASIGIAIFPTDGNTGVQLLNAADNAMYLAKSSGKNNFQFRSVRRNHQLARQIACEQDLQISLDSGQMVLHYQPQLDLNTSQITGVEALVRCDHPDFGLIMPREFIGIAERYALIRQLESRVLETACKHYSSWLAQDIGPAKLTLNISPIAFSHGDYLSELLTMLEQYRIPPSRIELEVTVTMLSDHKPHQLSTLEQLRQHGIHLALTGFNRGPGVINALHEFPISALKIDRQMTAEAGANRIVTATIKHLVEVAEIIDLDIVAEGIETPEQLEQLKSLGCHCGQGYLLGKPVPLEEMTAFLEAHANQKSEIICKEKNTTVASNILHH